jgi:hypothetical protein
VITSEVQAIAQARATMLMRGFDPLRLEMGVETARRLSAEVQNADVLFSLPVKVRADMEGWAVVPAVG